MHQKDYVYLFLGVLHMYRKRKSFPQIESKDVYPMLEYKRWDETTVFVLRIMY
jgi:hypothetical protein